jgi:CubicO group peptidase (beta-lactamase class C family)
VPGELVVVSLVRDRDRAAEPGALADELERRAPVTASLQVPLSGLATPRLSELEEAVTRIANPRVVFADYAHPTAGDRAAVWTAAGELARRGVPVVYAALADPRTLAHAPAGVAAVAAYDSSLATQRALAAALFGEIPLRGRLPVELDDARALGHGLEREAASALFGPDDTAVEHLDPAFDLAPVLEVLESGIRDGTTPGAVAVVGYRGRIVLAAAVGRTRYEREAPEVRLDTLYDLASLTKVVATTTLAMIEVERGRLDLEASIATYLPELRGDEKESIRVADLLAHSSGMLWWTDLYRRVGGVPAEEAERRALEEVFRLPLESAPGTATVYSDLGILLLGEILERLSGLPLDRLAAERIFRPLGMEETRYRPPADLLPRIAPTELDPWRGRLVHGEVHDENAAALGGVAPHAGLFSTAGDLAVFAQFLLDGGVYGGARLLRGDTIGRFTRRAERVTGSSRALGWDTPSEQSSAGRFFSASSYGHTGFTGTSLWIDPERELFAILLTNRVHPTRENRKISELRPRFHDAVVRALLGDAVTARPGSR